MQVRCERSSLAKVTEAISSGCILQVLPEAVLTSAVAGFHRCIPGNLLPHVSGVSAVPANKG